MLKVTIKKIVLKILEFKITIKKSNGIRICLSPDTYALRLFFTKHKSNLNVGILKDRRSKKTYLDIGANVGWYSLCAANAGYEKVVAVEANPTTYSNLINNIKANKLENRIIALNLAISDNCGLVKISNFLSSDQNKILPDDLNSTTVIAFSLDYLMTFLDLTGPAHLKVDVEGAEKLLIDGAKTTLESKLFTTIEIECTNENAEKCFLQLEEYGYMLVHKFASKLCINAKFEIREDLNTKVL